MAMAAGILSFFVRALRWKQLLNPMDENIPLSCVFNSVNISYLVNLALPRVGEFVRCGVVARRLGRFKDDRAKSNAGYDMVLGTVLLERVWDVLMMAVLLAVVALAMWGKFGGFLTEEVFAPFLGSLNINIGVIAVVVLLFLVALLWFLWYCRDRSKPLKAVWNFIVGLVQGAKTCLKMKRGWLFVVWTLVIWGLYWLMSICVLMAVRGMDSAALSADMAESVGVLASFGALDALFLMLVGSLSSLVPVPGGFGAFHYIVAMALSSVYGLPFEVGIIFATLSHESQTVSMILCGGVSYFCEFRKLF